MVGRRIAFLILFLLILPLISAQDCETLKNTAYPGDKAYRIEKAYLTYTILPDGRVLASEKITFDFYKGLFSFAYRDVKIPQQDISHIEVWENNVPVCFDVFPEFAKGKTRIKWYYAELENSKRTFDVRYTLKSVLTSYDDYTEFYWKALGDEWAAYVLDLEGRVELPKSVGDPKEVYTWGHPEFKESKIGITANKDVVFQVKGVQPRRWVEMRVAFPTHLLDSRDGTVIREGNGLEKIMKDEQWNQVTRPKTIYYLLIVGIPSLVVILFILLWYFFGKEPKVGYQGIYEREIPYDYSPAIVSSLLNQDTKKPDAKAFSASLLDLVHRKYFELAQTTYKNFLRVRKDDYHLSLTKKGEVYEGDRTLTGSEKKLMSILSVHLKKGPIRIGELKKKLKDYSFYLDFKEWSDMVKDEAKEMGLHGKNGALTAYKIFLVFVVGMSMLSLYIVKSGQYTVLLGVIIGSVVLGNVLLRVFREALPQRTVKGALHFKKWMALKRFLNDFSRLDEVPPGAIALWEQYIVYGLVLGETKNIEKVMKVKFHDVQAGTAPAFFGMSIAGVSGIAGILEAFSGFSTAVSSSSGTGGGGGFGGGGGGGGSGGGGGGAG